jgi:hypothetical protein
MSKGQYAHLHHDSAPNTVVCHHPDGTVLGYIARVRVEGLVRPGFLPLDENREPLTDWQETRSRALEWIVER